MPKLIVRDGGNTRSFRLTKEGRLTLGSASSNKLVLSSSGVQSEHAVLVVRAEAASLDALAPVEIDGEKFSGVGLALPLGSRVKLGDAELELQGDEPAATPARGSGAGARAGGKSSAKSGSARGGAAAGSKGAAGSKNASAGAAASDRKPRASDRLRQKPERPAWMVPAIMAGAVLVVVAIIAIVGGGGGTAELLVATKNYLEDGNVESARTLFDKINASAVSPKHLDDYNATKARLEGIENEHAVGYDRGRATKWADKHLLQYPEKYLGAVSVEKDSEALRSAKMRLWLQKFAEFESRFPDHASPIWQVNRSYADMLASLFATRESFKQHASISAAPTREDVEWSIFYYTDPSAKTGRRFDLARKDVERYSASGGGAQEVEAWRTLVDQRAVDFSAESLDMASKFYQRGREIGGENNSEYLKAAAKLIDVALVTGMPDTVADALQRLSTFPNIDQIMLSYVAQAAKGDDSAEDKVAFLESSRPEFHRAAQWAREELKRFEDEAAARK